MKHVVRVLAVLLLVAACTSSQDGPSRNESSNPSKSNEPELANATILPVTESQWGGMKAVDMWRPGCPANRGDLRRVEINHYTFDGEVRRGVLVVNKDVAKTVVRIFTELFEAEFPIRKMRPVEAYKGDANASLKDDNTSAYNCRRLSQINAPPMLSPHANGRAVDINPRENPWKDLRCNCWFPSSQNKSRQPGPGVILEGGLAWRLFQDEGWIWQNIDVPDYMHFDTGYPSKPFTGANVAATN